MRPALALLPAAALVLTACASGPSESGPTGVGATGSTSGSATTGTSRTATAGSPSSAPTSAAASTALPTAFIDVNKDAKDAELGQTLTVKRVARALPWPAGYNASAQAYELVGVEMTWTPSTTYTIPISATDFAVNTGSQFPNAPTNLVDATLKAAGWTLLPANVSTGNAVTGWLVFKVDPKAATKLSLDYKRPASKVSGSTQTFPEKTVTIPLVG